MQKGFVAVAVGCSCCVGSFAFFSIISLMLVVVYGLASDDNWGWKLEVDLDGIVECWVLFEGLRVLRASIWLVSYMLALSFVS